MAAAAAAANGSKGTEKRNCEEQASERACGRGGDMSALQNCCNATRLSWSSLPSLRHKLGTVSVSAAAGRIVSFFGGISGCSQNGDHPYQVGVFFFFCGIFICSQSGDHPYQVAVFFLNL